MLTWSVGTKSSDSEDGEKYQYIGDTFLELEQVGLTNSNAEHEVK